MPPELPPSRGIEWNKVTWYSKLGAVVLFIGVVPTLTFYIGMQYQAVQAVQNLVSTGSYKTAIPIGASHPIQNATSSTEVNDMPLYLYGSNHDELYATGAFVAIPDVEDDGFWWKTNASEVHCWRDRMICVTSIGVGEKIYGPVYGLANLYDVQKWSSDSIAAVESDIDCGSPLLAGEKDPASCYSLTIDLVQKKVYLIADESFAFGTSTRVLTGQPAL